MWSHVLTLHSLSSQPIPSHLCLSRSLSTWPYALSLSLALSSLVCHPRFSHQFSHLFSPPYCLIIVFLNLFEHSRASQSLSLSQVLSGVVLRKFPQNAKLSQNCSISRLFSECFDFLKSSLRMSRCLNLLFFSIFSISLNCLTFSQFLSLSQKVSNFLKFSHWILGLRNKGFQHLIEEMLSQYVSPIFSNVFFSNVLNLSHFSHCSSFSVSIFLIFLVSLSFLRISLFQIENSHLLNINLSFPRALNFLKSKFILTNFSMVSKDLMNNNVWLNGRLLPWRLRLPHCKGPNHEITLSFSFEKKRK